MGTSKQLLLSAITLTITSLSFAQSTDNTVTSTADKTTTEHTSTRKITPQVELVKKKTYKVTKTPPADLEQIKQMKRDQQKRHLTRAITPGANRKESQQTLIEKK